MRCHVCNVAVGDGQRFCHECGQSLKGVTDPTEPLPSLDDTSIDRAAVRSGGERITNEDVDPPPIRVVEDSPTDRGDLPDLVMTPDDPIGVRDESWWSEGPDMQPAVGPDERPPAPTEPIEVVPSEPDPAATTTQLDAVSAEPAADAAPIRNVEHEATTTMPAVSAGGATAAGVIDTDEFARTPGVGDTTQMPAVFDGAHDVEPDGRYEGEGFRLRVTLVLSLLAVVAMVMVTVADVIDIRTSRPVDGIFVGLRELDFFGSNLAVAGLIGTGLMLFGALMSCFGQRWGAGLAGGSGLATLGWAAMTLGLVEVKINEAQQNILSAGVEVTLATTLDVGWFLIAAVGAVGLLVFLASVRLAGSGRRRGLNPWIAALGALAMVIVAAGPLIPLGDAVVRNNLANGDLPQEFLAARLVQVALIAFTGVLGFLSVRTYGLGFAAGGLGVSVWLWITTFAEYGPLPVGIGVGNVGVSNPMPHAVTSVGVAAALAMLAVAATLALLGRPRH